MALHYWKNTPCIWFSNPLWWRNLFSCSILKVQRHNITRDISTGIWQTTHVKPNLMLDLCMWPLAYNYKYTERTGMQTFPQKYTDQYERFFSLQAQRLLRRKVIIRACWHHLVSSDFAKKHSAGFGWTDRILVILAECLQWRNPVYSHSKTHSAEVDNHVLMASILDSGCQWLHAL